MLDAFSRLELGIDLGRGGSYDCVSTMAKRINHGLGQSLH